MQAVSHLAALADFYSVDSLVACPREEHSAICEKRFGFVRLAELPGTSASSFRTSLSAALTNASGYLTAAFAPSTATAMSTAAHQDAMQSTSRPKDFTVRAAVVAILSLPTPGPDDAGISQIA